MLFLACAAIHTYYTYFLTASCLNSKLLRHIFIYCLIQVFKLLSYLDIGKIHIAPFDSRQCLKCQIFSTATICSLPSPSPIIPFFFAFVPIFSRGNACYAGKFFCLITRVANRTQSNSNRSIDFEWGSLIFFFLIRWGGRLVGFERGGGGHYAKKYGKKNIPGVPGYPKSTALRALRYPLCPIILWLLTA